MYYLAIILILFAPVVGYANYIIVDCTPQPCTITNIPVSNPPVVPFVIEGHGKNAVGGYGAPTVLVDRMDDPATAVPGTLRYAVGLTTPRHIIFDVTGPIQIDRTRAGLNLKGGHVTVDGGLNGVTIEGGTLGIIESETIIHNMRIRLGLGTSYTKDAISIGANVIGNNLSNIVLDHCSLSWSEDELLGINSNNGDVSGVTIQHSILSEPLGTAEPPGHAFGSLVHGLQNHLEVTYYHNIMANAVGRVPETTQGTVDVVNNVIYNIRHGWSRFGSNYNPVISNVMNNYYQVGPDTVNPVSITVDEETAFATSSSIFIDGNFHSTLAPNAAPEEQMGLVGHKGLDGSPTMTRNVDFVTSPLPHMLTIIQSASEAYTSVLATAGTPNRDVTDLRTVNSIINDSGAIVATPPL